jgi:pSer/pThr/pTyr-binding forkhead associated (FHA) protein
LILRSNGQALYSNFVIDDAQVSRNHLEFYSIDFEEKSNVQPLIYVRDRQSQNGTHVNGGLVGRGPRLSTARVLQNGDVVQIRPHLSFQVVHYGSERPCIGLSEAQRKEVKVSDLTICPKN